MHPLRKLRWRLPVPCDSGGLMPEGMQPPGKEVLHGQLALSFGAFRCDPAESGALRYSEL